MTGETKKTKETVANQSSQGSDGTGEGRSALPLPAELLRKVFGFFRPTELARIAPVSKYFLFAANDLEDTHEFKRSVSNHGISFAPGRNDELNQLVQEVAQSHTDFTSLHRILLQPGHQATDTQRQLFSYVRGEILAGKLSLKEAIDQIKNLRDLSAGVLSSELLLAKRLGGQLEVWQRDALRQGFTFSDLCSRWMSPRHVAHLASGQQQTVGQLRGLESYQVVGLWVQFTLAQVRSEWFTPLHVEAAQPPYQIRIIGPITSENILKHILGISITTIVSPVVWRDVFSTSQAEHVGAPLSGYEETPLYLTASHGCAAILRAMYAVGGYSPQGWRNVINRPMLEGDFAGRTPFYAAASNGGAAAVLALGQAGNCAPPQWRSLIEGPLLHGSHRGMTPLYAAAINNQPAVINVMRRVGGYKPAQWHARITAPLTQGSHMGATPLYMAADKGYVAVLNAMRWAVSDTEQEWRELFAKPLEGGPEAGRTPFYAAAVRGHIAVIKFMLEAGGYTPQQWRELIETPLQGGHVMGVTIFHATAIAGHADILDLMRQAGRYTQQQWRTLITTPIKSGALAGETPLLAASCKCHIGVLDLMLRAGGYGRQEWRDLLAGLSVQKSSPGGTSSPAMSR